jgi:hypothetical protein
MARKCVVFSHISQDNCAKIYDLRTFTYLEDGTIHNVACKDVDLFSYLCYDVMYVIVWEEVGYIVHAPMHM